jgi:ankyrin repeat protein
LAGTSAVSKFGWKPSDFFDSPQVCDLCLAIQNHDATRIEQLIVQGVDVNTVGKDGMTPLLWSFADSIVSRRARSETFELLLDKGANPAVVVQSDLSTNSKIQVGTTVANMAAKSLNSRFFFAILKHGIDPNLVAASRSPDEVETLFDAVFAGYGTDKAAFAEKLIAFGPSQSILDRSVIEAVGCNEFGIAVSLLKAGASSKVYTDWGTIVHLVALEEFGARANSRRLTEYGELVKWLEANGEDYETAVAVVKRWNDVLASVPDLSTAASLRKSELRAMAASEPNPKFSEHRWTK